VKDYHAKLKELNTFFEATPDVRASMKVSFQGLQPPSFEQTAWELALATQSLAHIEPELAFAFSRVYGYQRLTKSGLEPGLISAYDELLKAIDGELAQ
jgi:hypothetical protein